MMELEMNEEKLNVSWEPLSLLPDSVTHFVVQYKEGPPGKSFDWIKVDKNQITVSLEGLCLYKCEVQFNSSY